MSGLPSVRIDDVEVGRICTQHLVDLGHRRIAFVGGNPDDHLGFPVAPDRRQGYQEVLCAAGVEVDPSLTVPAKFTTGAGVTAWTALGRLDPLPSAVVAASDEIAMGLIYAARRTGVRVPEDLSVVGVDDHDMAWLFDLTTVAQPVRDQGRIAARTLIEQLRAGGPPEPHVATVPVELIVRGTTAAPAERSRLRSRSGSPC
jgi:DNA-binding LacI/PurR family transcriptional regulator